jgi:hypothetical protein
LEVSERTPVDVQNHKFLSYITNEDFEQLDQKSFSVAELTNLLASSDHRQRLFALDILVKTC